MRRIISLSTAAAIAISATAGAQASSKVSPPAPGPLRPYVVPPVNIQTLANGMRIAVIEKHSLPVVTARIQVDAGAVREPAAKAGLAVLTASLLSEGTTELTGAQIAEKMADLGAGFGTSGTFGSTAATVTSLTDVFPKALALAATTVTKPAFTEADFARIRASSIAGYERSMAQGSAVASKIFVQSVYDANTPYSRLNSGTKASLVGITRDDVINWHRTMYSPATTTVMLVGDITPAQARAAVESAFAGWNAPTPTLPALSNRARSVSGTRIILVDRPGSVQTSMSIGQAVPAWDSKDYFAILGASQILGGSVSARMNANLREKRGWTYGAFSGYNPLAGVGTFSVTSEVRTNATDSAIAETVREVKRLTAEAVPAEEMRDQMNNIVASFPSSVQTVQGLMGRLTNVITYGLPSDFYTTYRERVAGITGSDITRVGSSVLTPNDLTIVAVGDLKSIEAPIRALNLGTVEVWDVDGNKLR